MTGVDWRARFERDRALVNARLEELLPPAKEEPASLHGAMRHAVLGGGKRLRAALCLGAHRVWGDPYPRASLDAACAIECLHAYTLVHDDLPALDNDDLRRGRPSCHRAFGEAVAILAGDALQAWAFETLAACGAPAHLAAAAVETLARSAGSRFLVGGQTADLESEGGEPTEDRVLFIHTRKTAELIAASLSVGATLAGATEGDRAEIHEAGRLAGLAFQIRDDLLDVIGDVGLVGKGLRKDAERKKMTYSALHGVEESSRRALALAAEATERVAALGDGGYVGYLFASMADRKS